MRDRRVWHAARERNRDWLSGWDGTMPPTGGSRPRTFAAMVRAMRRAARLGTGMPFVVEVDGQLVGQLSVNNIVRGSAQFCSVGYWIDEAHAGRGIMTRAVAMAIDHLILEAGLHRVEVAIRPENEKSLRVVTKLGLREIGYAPGYLHIDGDWRDHRLFAITREELGSGLVNRLEQQQSHQSHE
jgi:ribosomal-protein-alanine N-acetyltransferase